MKNAIFAALFLLCIPGFAKAADFNGYLCTQDCSGHEAGYNWAQDKGIEDPDDCGGNSNSFTEGCKAYAEEQQNEDSIENDPDTLDTQY